MHNYKTAIQAFEKLQKREHLLRVTRDRMGLGHISREEFRKASAEIEQQFKLTEEEEKALEAYNRRTKRRG